MLTVIAYSNFFFVGLCLADASILFHNFVPSIFKASNARVNWDMCNKNINVKSFCLFFGLCNKVHVKPL